MADKKNYSLEISIWIVISVSVLFVLSLIVVSVSGFSCEGFRIRLNHEGFSCAPQISRQYARCKGYRSLSEIQLEVIESKSFDVLKKLESGKFEDLWKSGHSLFKKELPKDRFISTISEISNADIDYSKASLVDAFLVAVHWQQDQPQSVRCDNVNVASYECVNVLINVGLKRHIVGVISLPGKPFDRTLTIRMADEDDQIMIEQLKFIGFSMVPSSYQGMDSLGYQKKGEKWLDEGKLLPAYLALVVASYLSSLSQDVFTCRSVKLNEKYTEVVNRAQFKLNMSKWNVGGTDYKILGINIDDHVTDLQPSIKYKTNGELEAKSIENETAGLFKYVETNYPEIGEMFNSIEFQAFKEAPIDDSRHYENLKTTLPFRKN